MYGKFNLSDRFISFNIFRLPENVYLYWKSWSIYFVNQVFGDTKFLGDTNGDGKTVIWYPQFKYYNFHKWTNNICMYIILWLKEYHNSKRRRESGGGKATNAKTHVWGPHICKRIPRSKTISNRVEASWETKKNI